MPLYVYQCDKCGNSDEYLMKMSESDIELDCEECFGNMHRVMGAIGNQVLKWTRRYVDEEGKDSVVPSSAPGGTYRNTNYKKRKYNGKKFYYDKVTGKMIERK